VAAAIDLAACAQSLHHTQNRLYENRFVSRMKERLIRTGRYSAADLAGCRTIYAIDDRVTAPSFGFGTADRYYETQSALRFVSLIRTPVLMIAAQDDPLVPYHSYLDPALRANPCIQVLTTRHGGHLGFLSRKKPRFWTDEAILEWITESMRQTPC
jgi:predicted alpha/beta-fold hydrolase